MNKNKYGIVFALNVNSLIDTTTWNNYVYLSNEFIC